MGEANDKIYEFKEFRLVTEDGTLWRGKERIPITQKTVELLTLLIEHRGHVVSRDHILERLWPETYVDENNLSVTISMLRKALGENAMRSDMIETIPRKGYRFNGDVRATPAIDEIIAVREITRAVVEQTHFEDENASQTLIALQKGSRRHRAMLAILSVTLGAVIAVLSIGYLIQKIPFSTRKVYSIAVLPLRNLTGSEAEQALAYGVTDSVVTKLSKVRGLAVRPIASVADLTDVQTDTVQIGKRLGVDAVLEGSIQRSGDLYRVSIRIHSIADDQIIWGSTIEHQVSQVFDLQRLIALQALEGLAVKLSDIDQRGLRGSPTEDPEAYREYAIGRFHLAKRTPTDIRRAIAKFENAIEQDVAFAGAFAGLATSYMLLSDSAIGVMSPKDGFPKAIDFANKAIALDPDCAEAHAVLGYSKTGYEW